MLDGSVVFGDNLSKQLIYFSFEVVKLQ